MPYVSRDHSGAITSISAKQGEAHMEFIPPSHREVVSFLTSGNNSGSSKETLSESDADFARASEDLINLLIQKNIILFTELPPAVQTKMVARERLRSNLGDSPYNFLDNSESI